MDTFEAIRSRRSIKHFDDSHQFTADEERELMELAIQSPTSFNMQNWRFVVVKEPELRAQIRAASYDQAQVTDASLLLIMTADLRAWAHDPQRYWVNAPKEVGELLSGWMSPFYEGNDQLQRDEAMRSIGIASQTVMLSARAMGYDSCPMIGFEADKVAELIKLPAGHVIGMMITIGKRTQDPWPKPGQLPIDDVLIENSF
ncbi:MAG: nitroreductase family protein [Phycisphaerales bacterium]